MKLIKPYTKILTSINKEEVYKTIEQVARTCYKSEDKITEDSAEKMVKNLIASGHEAMIEFFDITALFVCDRGVSHELVRHRVASYAQESTRYCNYSKDKFGNQITFVIPSWLNIQEGEYTNWGGDWVDMNDSLIKKSDENDPTDSWLYGMSNAETSYRILINRGWTAQQARSVLPNSLKTEINVKMNLRQWRHFFKLRCSTAAHPQMRELTLPLLFEMYELLPIVFEDLYVKYKV